MRAYERVYGKTEVRIRKATSNTLYPWSKSSNLTYFNAPTRFISKLGRTQPMQIGLEVEEIDQNTFYSYNTYHKQKLLNIRLNEIHKELLEELEEKESKVLCQKGDFERSSSNRAASRPQQLKTFLEKNLEISLYTTIDQLKTRQLVLDDIRKSESVKAQNLELGELRLLETELNVVRTLKQEYTEELRSDDLKKQAQFYRLIDENHTETEKIEEELEALEQQIILVEGKSNTNNLSEDERRYRTMTLKRQVRNEALQKQIDQLKNDIDKLHSLENQNSEKPTESNNDGYKLPLSLRVFLGFSSVMFQRRRLYSSFLRAFLLKLKKMSSETEFLSEVKKSLGIELFSEEQTIFQDFAKVQENDLIKAVLIVAEATHGADLSSLPTEENSLYNLLHERTIKGDSLSNLFSHEKRSLKNSAKERLLKDVNKLKKEEENLDTKQANKQKSQASARSSENANTQRQIEEHFEETSD